MNRAAFLTLFLPLLSLASNVARAGELTDSLHEGQRASLGVRAEATQSGAVTGEAVLSMSADFNFVPLPGGGSLNGTHAEIEVAHPLSLNGASVNRASFGLLQWSHLRALVVEFDQSDSTRLGVEALGVRIPFVFDGNFLDGSSYSIGHVGASIGYQWLDPAMSAGEGPGLGEKRDIHAGAIDLVCRFDHQRELSDRLNLRAYQEITYLALLGAESEDGEGRRFEYADRLRFEAGASLLLDLEDRPQVRWVERTHPGTGEVSRLRVGDEGMRLKWRLIDVAGAYDLIDHQDDRKGSITLLTGLAGEF